MGSPPEDEDFRHALRGVKPLSRKKRVEVRRGAPVLAKSLGTVSVDDAVDSDDELSFVRNKDAKDVLRKLRGGHWVVEDELDLHGLNRREAVIQADLFLKESVRSNRRCVRIIHGKGIGSHQRLPVLKAMLRKWLPEREEVLAFAQAPTAQGGSGAVLVLLNAKQQLR